MLQNGCRHAEQRAQKSDFPDCGLFFLFSSRTADTSQNIEHALKGGDGPCAKAAEPLGADVFAARGIFELDQEPLGVQAVDHVEADKGK